MNFSQQDTKFMRRAIMLAERGGFRVSPNPKVGAVIVSHGKLIAEGWHKFFGGPHAEINALLAAKHAHRSLQGGTLYVNLEPCTTHKGKKTPPCVNAIVQSGIKRIVIAMKDPNPRVCGRGVKALIHAGIKVEIGCLVSEATKINLHFITWMKTGMPFVSLKVAMSLDGKIATKTGESKWITCEKSRKFVRKLRDYYDAILVGSHTIINDNPMLAGNTREPKRIVLDSELCVPFSSNIFRNSNVLVITTNRAPLEKINQLKKRGISFHIINKKITIAPLLRFLAKQNISSLLVEGGAEIFGSFIDSRLVNRLYWFIAPTIIGGVEAKSAVAGIGVTHMKKALRINSYTLSRFSGDLLLTAQLVGSSKR